MISAFFNSFSKFLGFLLALLFFVILLVFFSIFLSNSSNNFSYYKGNVNSSKKIAVINLSGPIISEPINLNIMNSFEAITPLQIKNYLNELNNENISGMIISVNSAGGSVSATQEIYSLLRDFKNKKRIPIYFHTDNILASGAYWLAIIGEKIFANYGAIIGSIGVKGPDWIYYNSPTSISTGLFGSTVVSPNGIKVFSNTAGINKDIFNPFRAPSKKEVNNLQEMVDSIYEDFVQEVSRSRKLEKEFITQEIGAMIFHSKKATKNFLIDGEKNIDQVLDFMIKKLKIDDVLIIQNNKQIFNFFNINSLINLIYKNNNAKELIKERFCNNLKNEFSVVSITYQNEC